MKRSIAMLLALTILFALAVPALAAEGDAAPPADAVVQEPGPEQNTEPSPEQGMEPGPEQGTEPGPEQGTEPGPEQGTEPSPEQGTEPGPEQGTEPGPEQSTEPSPEQSTEPGPEQSTEPGPEQSAEPDPEQSTEPGPEQSAEPAPEQSETPAPEESATPSPEPSPSPEPGSELMLLSAVPVPDSQIDVTLQMAADLGALTPEFTIKLTNTTGELDRNCTDGASGKVCSFVDLPATGPDGNPVEYTLTVTAPGFATYTQKITVEPSCGILIPLTVGQLGGYGDMHPGVVRIGDVYGDGVISQNDKDQMMLAVDGGAPAEAGVSAYGFTDLNGDGATTLADAEVLAKNERLGEIPATYMERFVPAVAIAALTTNDTVASNPTSLFEDDGQTFTLQRAGGEAISADTPVEVDFSLADGAKSDAILIEGTNIAAGELIVTYADNTSVAYEIGSAAAASEVAAIAAFPVLAFAADGSGLVTAADTAAAPPAQGGHLDPSGGNITVDLGTQQAVKRVTLRITATNDGSSLASISQVEFVNGMGERIPEPEPDVPAITAIEGGSREFTVTWTPCNNITGYEVKITAGGVEEIVPLVGTSLTVTRFNNDEVLNYTTYTVCVQSVNGTWQSGWSAEGTVTPKPTGRPDKPDNVTATGGFETVTVSWKQMKDTVGYNLYYKEASATEFSKQPEITASSFVLSGLASGTAYEVYVTGYNEFGESEPSLSASATTSTLNPPEMPKFNLINQSGNIPGRDHIVSAVCNAGSNRVNSAVDPDAGSAWCTLDNDAASYYQRMTWDDGGFNWLGESIGLTYTFDGFYDIDTIGIMAPDGMSYGYAKIRWWDESGAANYNDTQGVIGVEYRQDAKGLGYYFLRLPEPIRTNKIQIGLSRAWVRNEISVAEVYFYKYDSLKSELMALYEDDLHTMLRPEVTEQTLNDLKARIETSVDEYNNVNPDKDILLREWDTAWKIFHDQQISKVIRIHDGITGSGDDHGFGGLNAWQPLGVVAAAGDKITVYVGHSTKATGSGTSLQLVATQYHAESSAMSTVIKPLNVGPNEITIPKIWKTTGLESGGALYVQYTGGAGTGDSYAVRVSGGVQVPVLDLYKVTDPSERQSRTQEYVTQLSAFVGNMASLHSQVHQGGDPVNAEVNYEYSDANCILGASDIMLDTMMLSLPAQQILSGCGGSAQTLLTSLDAMENMMGLFYQHKGLNANAPDPVDQIPRRHLNIRYMRMFSGAFMYASGDHIGIEYTETDDMAGCGGVLADASGLYQSGSYFGWGIAHEVGHDINQGVYAIAEVTNNYFAVLAQAQDTNGSVRFEYPKVYEKVTSGTKGNASNVFTQLGMYWQLHLAYDRGYNFKTYPDYSQQLANLFWARVDAYARTPSEAKGGLTLEGADRDQALMRLCCAAAEKNILDFFQRWGKTPDETTIAYASQFPEETRAIYYTCDDARRYDIEHQNGSKLGTEGAVDAIASVTAQQDPNQANKVNITVVPGPDMSADEILGYEIVRCTIADGAVEKRTVGFTTDSEFSDVIYAMNNRTVSYEVTLIDKYLNRSAVETTPMLKIRHEGDLDKTHWTVSTTGLKADRIQIQGTMDDPDSFQQAPEMHEASVVVVDGDVNTVYTPLVETEGACLEIDFHASNVVTGFRYTAGTGTPIGGYNVEVRQGGEWIHVDSGSLDGSKTVYFTTAGESYVSTYSADALRLTLTGQVGQSISVAEFDVLAPSGDNVEFGGEGSVGILSETYVYGDKPEDFIPAGSLVFTGSYAGNAAYNVVMLFDGSGTVVAGRDQDGTMVAHQIILSPIPDTGNIQDVNDGKWIYWIEPSEMDAALGFQTPTSVRAELYRVNNALTNEGQRLVSDSPFVTIDPANLGSISFTDASGAQAASILLTGTDPARLDYTILN